MLNPSKAVFNRAHDKVIFRRRTEVLASWLVDLFPAEATRLLDVGSGDGTIAALVRDRRPGTEVEGVDVLIRPRTLIPVQAFDGRTLPFSDGEVDVVTLIDVLHHVDDPDELLGECLRVSRHGVIIKDHFRQGPLAHRRLALMDWVGNRGHGVRLPYGYLSPQEWTELYGRLGTRIERVETSLGLYPAPVRPLFEDGLHFVARLAPVAP